MYVAAFKRLKDFPYKNKKQKQKTPKPTTFLLSSEIKKNAPEKKVTDTNCNKVLPLLTPRVLKGIRAKFVFQRRIFNEFMKPGCIVHRSSVTLSKKMFYIHILCNLLFTMPFVNSLHD